MSSPSPDTLKVVLVADGNVYKVTLLIKVMKTMKMVLMLLLLMSIKVMMRDDEVQISKRSVMILKKSEC